MKLSTTCQAQRDQLVRDHAAAAVKFDAAPDHARKTEDRVVCRAAAAGLRFDGRHAAGDCPRCRRAGP